MYFLVAICDSKSFSNLIWPAGSYTTLCKYFRSIKYWTRGIIKSPNAFMCSYVYKSPIHVKCRPTCNSSPPPNKKGKGPKNVQRQHIQSSPVQSRYSKSNWAIGRRVLAMQQANAACLSFLLPAQETGREITYHQTLNWTKWWWTRYISLQSITKLPPSLPQPALKKKKTMALGEKKFLNNNNEQTWFIHVREGDLLQQVF